jgi:pantetheine-phosphate adenylyltransferase
MLLPIISRYSDAFKLAGISISDAEILSAKLKESHRFYHNESHISDILDNIEKKYPDNTNAKDKTILILTAFFHDAIYDPRRKDNEQLSVEFFRKCISSGGCNEENAEAICQIILDTRNHKPSSELSGVFCDLDLYGLRHGDTQRVFTDEQNIFKEFQFYDYSDYKSGRIQFLEAYRQTINNDVNVDFLKSYLSFRRPKIGVYAGSFNPLHIGHRNIIQKAEILFDKVIIAKGHNPEKKNYIDGADILLCNTPEVQKMSLQKELPYHQVEVFEGFLTDFVASKSTDADVFIVRGLRNGKDLDYEVNQLRFMEGLDPRVKMVFIHCDKEHEHISSSAIRLLEGIKKGSADQYIK